MIGNLSKSKTLKGEQGKPGNDGYSPKITVTDIENRMEQVRYVRTLAGVGQE